MTISRSSPSTRSAIAARPLREDVTTFTPGHSPGSQSTARSTRPCSSTAISAAEPVPSAAVIGIPSSRRVEASMPGSISAGASAARLRTSSQMGSGTRSPVT